jgi:cytochrome c553
MSDTPLFSSRNPWFARSVGLAGGVFLIAAAAGFIVLPYLQPNIQWSGLWDMICSAAGVARPSSAVSPIPPDFKTSNVVVTSDMLQSADAGAIGRGATLAHKCAICHGPTGLSYANSPNLAGQFASAIYKQLQDFKSGARVNAVMTPFALPLSDQDIVDVSVYYASLARPAEAQPAAGKPAPRIVLYGVPSRGIAPCGSCHGGLDQKAGSPWLDGQPAAYVKAQLVALKTGARRNDIGEQMRNIARNMSDEEIDAAAQYFGARSAAQ